MRERGELRESWKRRRKGQVSLPAVSTSEAQAAADHSKSKGTSPLGIKYFFLEVEATASLAQVGPVAPKAPCVSLGVNRVDKVSYRLGGRSWQTALGDVRHGGLGSRDQRAANGSPGGSLHPFPPRSSTFNAAPVEATRTHGCRAGGASGDLCAGSPNWLTASISGNTISDSRPRHLHQHLKQESPMMLTRLVHGPGWGP